jgi:hypothetical protein
MAYQSDRRLAGETIQKGLIFMTQKKTGTEMRRFTLWLQADISDRVKSIATASKRSEAWVIRETMDYVTQRPELVEAIGLKNK